MRLVDADAMKKQDKEDIAFGLWMDMQPTAYDTKRVQDELTRKMNHCAKNGKDGAGRAYDDACVIVQQGYLVTVN